MIDRGLFIFLGILIPLLGPAQSPDKWIYKGEKEGIKIYHQDSESLLHIKLVTSVKAPLAGIVALFSDVDTYRSWGYKMTEAKLLERVNETELVYYARYDFPWPMDDRDIILHSRIEQDPKTKIVRIINTPYPNYLPPKNGLTRIKNTRTRWQFSPGTQGWVQVEQQISTDSAAGLPDWLVNMTADTGPRETAKGVRRVLQQARFQQASSSFIKE